MQTVTRRLELDGVVYEKGSEIALVDQPFVSKLSRTGYVKIKAAAWEVVKHVADLKFGEIIQNNDVDKIRFASLRRNQIRSTKSSAGHLTVEIRNKFK